MLALEGLAFSVESGGCVDEVLLTGRASQRIEPPSRGGPIGQESGMGGAPAAVLSGRGRPRPGTRSARPGTRGGPQFALWPTWVRIACRLDMVNPAPAAASARTRTEATLSGRPPNTTIVSNIDLEALIERVVAET